MKNRMDKPRFTKAPATEIQPERALWFLPNKNIIKETSKGVSNIDQEVISGDILWWILFLKMR